MTYTEKLNQRIRAVGSSLCVGLDPRPELIRGSVEDFLKRVVDETAGDRTPNAKATLALFEATKKRGLLIGKGGLYGNALRVAPPLVATVDDVDQALEILDFAFAEVQEMV